MNDLAAFDLNQLQMPNNRWEILIHGEASPKMPAPRTNHSMITYNDKLYLYAPSYSPFFVIEFSSQLTKRTLQIRWYQWVPMV